MKCKVKDEFGNEFEVEINPDDFWCESYTLNENTCLLEYSGKTNVFYPDK